VNKQIVAAIGALLLLASSAGAQTNDPRCNNGLIRGDYAFTIEGQKLAPPGPVGSQVGVAMTTFDGHGDLTQTDTVVIGGTLAADFSHPVATGHYSVNRDCTGTFTIQFQDGRPPVTVNFVLAYDGNEIDTVVLPPPGMTGPLVTRSIGKRKFFTRPSLQDGR
jgi:hypothetical protein